MSALIVRNPAVSIVIIVQCQPDLLQIILALRPARCFAGLLHCWQQQRNQHRDDCDDHQQFNQRKSNPLFSHKNLPERIQTIPATTGLFRDQQQANSSSKPSPQARLRPEVVLPVSQRPSTARSKRATTCPDTESCFLKKTDTRLILDFPVAAGSDEYSENFVFF